MGLDWTAALLPGERPSWCSGTQEPLSPPSAFALPPPVSTITGDGKGGLVRRAAAWRWEEGEWKVVVKPENAGVKRVEKVPPALKDDAASASPSTSKLGKAKMKATEMGNKLRNNEGSTGDVENASDIMASPTSPGNDSWHDESEDDDGEPNTDVDGWVYGDNKWRASSHSNGIGKVNAFFPCLLSFEATAHYQFTTFQVYTLQEMDSDSGANRNCRTCICRGGTRSYSSFTATIPGK